VKFEEQAIPYAHVLGNKQTKGKKRKKKKSQKIKANWTLTSDPKYILEGG
jgi:hypothetical protein